MTKLKQIKQIPHSVQFYFILKYSQLPSRIRLVLQKQLWPRPRSSTTYELQSATDRM